MTDIAIRLVREPAHVIAAATSAELFEVSNANYNRHSRHQIRAFTGLCCDVWYTHLHLNATASVIAERAIGPAPVVHTVMIGDVVNVDFRDYLILGQRHGDPIMVPTKFIRQLTAAGVIK